MNELGQRGLRAALAISLGSAGCHTGQEVSFRRDVQPILAGKCGDCHLPPEGSGYLSTGLDLSGYESLMAGSVFGPVVVPGHSETSPLNMLVEGRAGGLKRLLKARHQPITQQEAEILHVWVDQGARDN